MPREQGLHSHEPPVMRAPPTALTLQEAALGTTCSGQVPFITHVFTTLSATPGAGFVQGFEVQGKVQRPQNAPKTHRLRYLQPFCPQGPEGSSTTQQ